MTLKFIEKIKGTTDKNYGFDGWCDRGLNLVTTS